MSMRLAAGGALGLALAAALLHAPVARTPGGAAAQVRTATGALPRASRPARRAHAPALVSGSTIDRAQAWARRRPGVVAFAVLDTGGRLRGLNRTARFPSASLVKAMLLAAELRRIGPRPLDAGTKALLAPMITASDNEAAHAVYARVGRPGLLAVARAARMRRFDPGPSLFDAQMTPADMARLFLRIDRIVPSAHRAYARRLLAGIVSWQRWGIAPAAREERMEIFFKGGWRPGLTHQAALLTRRGRRVALAVLTSGTSQAEGEASIEGIARRVLR